VAAAATAHATPPARATAADAEMPALAADASMAKG
jgi:hypothetical protein